MKRWISSLLISSYLAALGYGLVCHTFSYRQTDHPMMYFIIWDMFCGWSAYADATKIVAEGESGKFYELAPGPWGSILPYGSVPRHDYDSNKQFFVPIALNTLKHTDHEPIARILIYEEIWAKKFDLPDPIWNARYDVPKDVQKYLRLRAEMTEDGRVVRTFNCWHDNQSWTMLADNPRLISDARNGQSFFAVDELRSAGSIQMKAPQGN